ncbi:MAG: DUF4139 domain-containing protein [Candidatus Methanoperedens sp.]|nr:DUF4139 domain-containing protein [Candidatus Methanoperedens sp.]MCZ7395867.1 DUF4139 domain-containing protein [Candidatus Methanoperedens sp.]
MLNQSMLRGIYQSLKSTSFKKLISLIVIALLLVSLAALWESREENNWNNIEGGATIVSKEVPKVALLSIAKAATPDKTKNEVTVYNQNLALVKEYRTMDLSSGNNIIKYVDVASQIDPTSVMFNDPKSQNTVVVEQNYEYDLVSSDQLLDKYLDKEITVTSDNESFTGKLLSRSGGITLETQKGVVVLNNVKKIEYPDSAGLLTKPTLIWQIYTDSSGSREVETTYLTGGMNWKANYIATIDQSDSKANIKGWVTIENNAGTAYPDAKLKLVAGDINRVEVPQYYYDKGVAAATAIPAPMMGAPPGFTQEGLFEYHLYTLQRPTTLNNNEIKQISLLSADNVPAKKEYSYDGARDGEKVRVVLNITNSEENGLGMPLPKGVVRVYKADSDGQLQFLGEDSIDHTPKDEKLRINVGNAFDIVGKRLVTDREGMGAYGNRESYSIELKNHKTEDAKIIVTEQFYGNWQITKASEQYKKKDANTIEFEVNVPKDGTKTINYTVETRYQ